ncbi:MAG: hypothetical protein WC474_13580 [Hydrogenophilaceae bacterium]
MNTRIGLLMVALMAAGSAPVLAAKDTRKQVVKPPQAQAWIDVATFSGMTMPAMGGMGGMASMMSGMFGGMTGHNAFGNTETGTAGSWVDVTLYARDNPRLEEGIQTVPAGSKLAPELKLVSPKQKQSTPAPEDDQVVKEDFEPPKGKIYLYWGCGDTVRPGQPKVLDMAKASMTDYRSFFANRRATQRGAHLAAGRPVWPNEQDARMVPQGASLVGEHAFKAQGVPDGFKFAIGPAQDIMPAIELNQRETATATMLEWQRLPAARAYFLSAMGGRGGGGGENEMVFWTSSEVPEIGTGLMDYQTNPAVDNWLKEKVLLSPEVKTCAVPKGIFGEGAMLRMIAYGTELQLAHPARPTDPKIAWEPQWNAKVRVKSVTSAMLGMTAARPERGDAAGRDYTSQSSGGGANNPGSDGGIGQGLNKLKGLFGF